MKKIIYFILIVYSTNLYAQIKDVVVTKLLDKSYSYALDDDYTISLQLIDKAIALSKPKNDYIALAFEYALKSDVFVSNNQIIEAKNAMNLSFDFAEKSKNNLAYARAYLAKSNFYKHNELLDLSIDHAQKGLKFLKSEKDYILLSNIYWNIYYAHTTSGNLKKIEKYVKLDFKYAEKSKNVKCKIDAYSAKMNYFNEIYITKNKKHVDSILYYINKTKFLCEKFPRQMGYNTYTRAQINMASYYFAFLPQNKETKEKIFHCLNLAEETIKKHPLKYDFLTNCFGLKGVYSEREGDLVNAEKYYLLAEKKLLKVKAPNYYTWGNIYMSLSNLYEKKKDFKKAFIYQKKLEKNNKKLNNQEQIKNVQKLEIQYEVEKKNIELKMYKEREEGIKLKNYLYLGLIVITLLSFVFMFRSYHYKLKYSAQRELELEAKKQEAELQSKLEKKEKERIQLEQELLSVKQNQLQKEIMANNLQLSRKNEILQQIKTKISKGEINEAKKVIKEEIFVDNEFEEIKSQIQQINPYFFNILNEKSSQKLSQLDMKYCAYLHLQMNTKQIANLLHIEAKSVRVAKYRLKQKIGLTKNDDLDNFLQELGNVSSMLL